MPSIQNLKNSIKSLRWYERFLFPRRLKSMLESPQSSSYEIYKAYAESTWFFQRWFIKCLQVFSQSEDIKLYQAAKRIKFLSGESGEAIFSAIIRHNNPLELCQYINQYKKYGFLLFLLVPPTSAQEHYICESGVKKS